VAQSHHEHVQRKVVSANHQIWEDAFESLPPNSPECSADIGQTCRAEEALVPEP
jgi:hypothetical protein